MIYEANIPTWALSAIVNNDYSGLNEEDVQSVDSFVAKHGNLFESNYETFFSWSPEFGLACECVTAKFISKP